MAINIVANLEANTKEAVRQVDKVNEKVKEVSRNAKKAGDDLTESMVIGNAAVKQVDKVTGGLASSLVKVAKAAKLSGKAMRVALLSTGIGAITIAVGLLVEYWDEITDLINGSNKELEKQIVLNNQNLDAVDRKLRNTRNQIELEKKQGKNVDALIEKEKALIEEKRKTMLAQIELEKSNLRNLQTEAETLTTMEFIRQGKKGISEITEEENEALLKQKEILSNIENAYTQFESSLIEEKTKPKDTGATDAEKLAEQQRLKAIDDKAASIEEITKLEDDYLQSKLSKEQQEINAARDKYFTLIEEAKKYSLDTTLLEEARLSEINDITKKYEDEAKEKRAEERETNMEAFNQKNDDRLKRIEENAKRELEIQQDLADAEANIIDAKLNFASSGVALLGQLAGENKAMSAGLLVVEKGLAIADVIINASRSIAAAKANLAATPAVIGVVPNPMYGVQAATTAKGILSTKLAAAASIATIAAQAIPGLSGGGGGGSRGVGGGGGDTGSQAPAFNVVGASGETQLADAIGSQTQRPARAYVVSNDVTTAQEMDRNIIEGASIG